ncbi:hypothetical protein KFE25_012860 [Diacronema lutheri]|uniref:Bifunctional lysine-specific demethylase and histidyl-hydroxylase n=2 Tax=Diacronema lutheri TaxID=2081491 RepID=A0A8J5XAD1_DIALT|nr:hypothetical protein KFE25_012860 [Diacronema lutheri]
MLALVAAACCPGVIARPTSAEVLRRASVSVGEAAVAYTGEDHAERLAAAQRWADGLGTVARELRAPAGAAGAPWQRAPLVTRALAPLADGYFTVAHLAAAVERNFLDAGLGVYDARGRAGWQMGRVGTPRGASFEEAKLTWAEVEAAMGRGTVVFNSFGAHEPALAQLCLGAVHAFGLPANLNLYLTRAGLTLSAPPHTDKQDVLVIQTQGAKHWRVYAPPEPALRPHADPLSRGKADDRLDLAELSETPLLEVDLRPGDALYVPAGFPHTTSTSTSTPTPTMGDDAAASSAARARAAPEPSLHLTLNVDTHIWALTYDSARRVALARAREADAVRPRELPLANYLRWQDTLPVGFCAPPPAAEASGGAARGADVDAARAPLIAQISRELGARLCEAEPERWGASATAAAADDALARLGLNECAARMAEHAAALVDVQRRLYIDGALELTPTPHGVSLFRVRPYLDELEGVMGALSAWAGLAPGALASDGAAGALPGAASVGRASSRAPRADKAKGGGGKAKKGGFGK